MKANELRIGNFVNVPREDQSPFRIDVFEYLSNTFIKVAMTHPEFGNKMHPLTWYGEDLKPIPLTEEWLVKFGFVKKNIGEKLPQSWYELKYLSNEHDPMITSWVSILINIETWSCVICDEYPDEMGANTKVKIEHVHQLQNLYFALTGEELTIKENEQTN